MSFLAPRAAALMCHAPIVIPAISGERGRECEATTRAMVEAAEVLAKARPASVVVLSPHAPRFRDAFTWKRGKRWIGSFSNFGRPDLRLTFEADLASADALVRIARQNRLPLEASEDGPMDHGALVPLWFLREAGYSGKILILGFPWRASDALMECFAMALGEAMTEGGRPWSLLASGDMSHRLRPGAPSGFHPQAQAFDKAVVDCIRAGRPGDVAQIGEELRELAAEDVTESLRVASCLLGDQTIGQRFLSYEGPFGVGYLIAILRSELP